MQQKTKVAVAIDMMIITPIVRLAASSESQSVPSSVVSSCVSNYVT
jgi:hypothetical protein